MLAFTLAATLAACTGGKRSKKTDDDTNTEALVLHQTETTDVPVASDADVSEHSYRLVDDGDLLSEAQETAIAELLDEISEKHELDLVIVTEKTLDGKDTVAFADDYYDYHGYREDGILLLYCPNEGARYISTTGDAIEIFDDAAFDLLIGEILPYFNRGDLFGACLTFADACDRIVTSARNMGGGA